jgi:hypothetical protein
LKKTVKLFKKQIEFFRLQDRNAHFDGGIGTGKTTILGFWLGCMVQQYPNTKWLLAARDYKQLKAATTVEFEWALRNWLGLEEDVHYTKVVSPTFKYTFYNGSEVHAVGAHNYDTVFRGGNYNGAACDEVDYWKPEAWLAMKGRVRRAPEFIRSVSSPKGYNHIYEDFFENQIGPVVTASTYDNPTLSEAYIESLKKSYSPRLFEQEVLGKRLRLNVGAVYSEFNRDIHVRPCRNEYDEKYDLYFFTDYNISHYCGCYMFKKNGIVYVVGEEHLQFEGSRKMAQVVYSKYPQAIVIGDSTGNNKRDVAIDRTNYQHFKAAGLRTRKFRNPPVQSRIIGANSNLYHNRVVVDPSCKTLIRDLELLAWKEDGRDIDKSDITLSHASDAFAYGMHYHLPLKPDTSATASFS